MCSYSFLQYFVLFSFLIRLGIFCSCFRCNEWCAHFIDRFHVTYSNSYVQRPDFLKAKTGDCQNLENISLTQIAKLRKKTCTSCVLEQRICKNWNLFKDYLKVLCDIIHGYWFKLICTKFDEALQLLYAYSDSPRIKDLHLKDFNSYKIALRPRKSTFPWGSCWPTVKWGTERLICDKRVSLPPKSAISGLAVARKI